MRSSRTGLVPFLLCAALLAEASCSASAQPVSKSSEQFLEVVAQSFVAWDKDRDGRISPEELDAAVVDKQTTGKEAAAAASLKRAARSMKSKLPPLTLDNIRQLSTGNPVTNSVNLPRIYLECLRRITNAVHRELFVSGLPRLDTIHQGRLGNCFCLAPLGAMVNRDPQQVAAMFQPQADGTYRVTLGKCTLSIAPPTDAEIAMTSSNEHDGIWVNLYEKAVGEARNNPLRPDQRTRLPIDALARGGSAGTMLAFITGHEITRFSFKFAKDPAVSADERESKLADLRRQLTAAAKEKRLMTCGTLKTTTPGLTPNHAYALLGYEPNSDSVKLWNPHGGTFSPKGPVGLTNGYPQKEGVFSVPVNALVNQFSGMASETTNYNQR